VNAWLVGYVLVWVPCLACLLASLWVSARDMLRAMDLDPPTSSTPEGDAARARWTQRTERCLFGALIATAALGATDLLI
jgi:hypothetical protein